VACELLGVSTSGFYAWAARAPSDRALSDAWLIEKIKHVHAEKRGVDGSRRVTAELRLGEGVVVARKRVQRLMRAAGLSGLTRVKRGRTTIRVPGVRVADDLVERRFRPEAPDVLWVADITYLRAWEGCVYLAAVQDAFSRRIVGWSMADHMRAELVVDALEMALHAAAPPPAWSITPIRAASSSRWPSARRHAMPASPSRWAPRAALDNAVAESFFATLKKELVHRRSWPTRRALISEVFEFVEGFYNTTRRHSTVGYLSPAQFEKTLSPTINKENG
jgi:transposase InsO family protein